jgi:hypothetical protein
LRSSFRRIGLDLNRARIRKRTDDHLKEYFAGVETSE